MFSLSSVPGKIRGRAVKGTRMHYLRHYGMPSLLGGGSLNTATEGFSSCTMYSIISPTKNKPVFKESLLKDGICISPHVASFLGSQKKQEGALEKLLRLFSSL